MPAVEIRDVTKRFGTLVAVNEMNLSIDREIFGLLGPNGSGKTTTVKMLTTLLTPTAGDAWICGHSILTDPNRVREQISYVPQDMAVDPKLTGRENVLFYAKLYGIPRPRETTDEALSLLELGERADDLTRTYSGGMRRRLELAQALVHDPEVLFLDEPTIGLDVAGRRRIWDHIITLKEKGMTIFVTTHYMDEADHACDRVGIIDSGTVVASDTPAHLKAEICRDIVAIRADGRFTGTVPDDITYLGQSGDELKFEAQSGEEAGIVLSRLLAENGMQVRSVSIRQPTLDDVFLALVGEQDESTAFDFQRFRTMLRRRR
ncbi:MAG: ABC transporter ATP-binding protein [Methanocalculus sp. MSAO_Arc1]|uniref:ABC transporter ATP-binding protein n=1 Tax=Methanocalculus TaxID=71151 RepID=UPI000FF26997|nr:ABC transporter ATP-binding protein [Methanocalculus sp. MSAO_Arc1]MCP1661529.1 ABC-2 type transport system ATP-binding protein [Methanocalculus sp. AMF5]RQD81012.1 MAG: ABC transporter ATP-binding protein [Methanocalculus sp. MSAO_Arc1]